MTRTKALERLALATPTDRRAEVAKAVEKLIAEQDPFVRKAAVKTLAVWGAKEQIPALGQALTHNDVFTRKAAIEALATFKEEQQAGDLIAKRLPEGAERGDASKALQAMGPVGQTAALKYMKHTEWTVRLEVCNILKVVGTQQCLKALQAAAAQDQNGIVRMAAGEAAQIAATRK